MKKIIWLTGLVSASVCAQSGTVSPYSYFGIGTTENFNNNRNYAMGQTGIALSSFNYLNNRNPASLGNMTSSTFIYDIGVYGSLNRSESYSDKQSVIDGNISNLSVGFPLSNKFGLMLGLEPVSQSKYTINTTIPVEGTSYESRIKLSGEGGITKVFSSLGFRVNDNLYLGGTVNYLFGSIDRLETINTGTALVETFTLKNANSYQGFSFGLGMQYHHSFSENTKGTFGGIINFKSKIHQEMISTYDLYVSSANTVYTIDTISRNVYLPQEIGVGFALDFKEKLTLSFDYAAKNWEGINYSSDTREIYQKEHLFNLGAEYRPRGVMSNYFNRTMYRMGLGYSTGNYKLYGEDIDKIFATAGIGYLLKPRFSINVSYSFTKKGWLSDAAMKDTYHLLSISFTGVEAWFTKRYQ